MAKGRKAGKPALSEAEKAERKQALKDETKAARFLRLGTPRVNKVLVALASLQKLAKGKAEYSPEQVQMMFKAIGDAAQRCMDAYSGTKASGDAGFKF